MLLSSCKSKKIAMLKISCIDGTVVFYDARITIIFNSKSVFWALIEIVFLKNVA